MSSDVEMDDSCHSNSDVDLDLEVIVAPDVLAACKRGQLILFIRASTTIGGHTRTMPAPLVNPPSSGSSVTNMREEEIAIGNSIGVADSVRSTLY